MSFIKAGLFYADRLTTVSPTYAREIQTPAFGWGLDGLLRSRAAVLSGILNGVDYRIWDPQNDANLPQTDHLEDAAAGKQAANRRCSAASGSNRERIYRCSGWSAA